MTKWMIGILVLIAVMGASLWKASFISTPPSPPAPNNPLFQSLDATQFKGLINKNKITLVNLWASWCGPCKAEIPEIVELRKRYQGRGLGLVLLSVDRPSERPDANAFLRDLKIDFLTYFAADPLDDTIQAVSSDGAGAIPASFLFNSNGERVDSWQGGGNLADFEAKILPLLTK